MSELPEKLETHTYLTGVKSDTVARMKTLRENGMNAWKPCCGCGLSGQRCGKGSVGNPNGTIYYKCYACEGLQYM